MERLADLYPMYIQANVNCIKYWLRLMRLDADRLPRKAYVMLLKMHDDGKRCWVTLVCDTLCKYGFDCVWLNQGVQNVNIFLRIYKKRLIDSYREDWQRHLNESDRFNVYRTFKLIHCIEPYFEFIPSKGLRKVLIRFRLGVSELLTHRLRYVENTPKKCPLCGFISDNEIHFLFHCENLTELRSLYIPDHYMGISPEESMCGLFNDRDNLMNLARFIYRGLNARRFPMNVN